MEELCEIKERLVALLYSNFEHLDKINAEEMGYVVDMIKDIEMAKYYHKVVEAMGEGAHAELSVTNKSGSGITVNPIG